MTDGVTTRANKVFDMHSDLSITGSAISPYSLAIATATLELHLEGANLADVSDLVSITPSGIKKLDVKWHVNLGSVITTFESEEPLPIRSAVRISTADRTLLVAPRRLTLDGLTNFRDFGGYWGESRHLSWGIYYRSENLHQLSPNDWSLLHQIGITRVIDLRNPFEKELQPTRLPKESNLELFEVEINGRIKGFEDALIAVAQGKLLQITEEDMAEMYLDILDKHLDDLAVAVALVESNQRGATLVHCTAGKDRTGLVAAIVQLRAGVSMIKVREDYLLSNLYRTPFRLRQLEPFFKEHKIAPLSIKPFLSAPWKAMQSALAELRRSHPQLLETSYAPGSKIHQIFETTNTDKEVI